MTSHDDQSRDSARTSRKFQPVVDQPLERREVPAQLVSATGGIANAQIVRPQRAQQASVAASTDWTSMSGLSWLTGVWRSKTQISVPATLSAGMGKGGIKFPSIPSLDTWIVGDNQYIGRSALAAQQQTVMPVDGIIIKPGVNPTLAMTTADGSAPIELAMVSSNKNSITFMGMSQQINTVTNSDGTTTNQVSDFAPVRVTLSTRSQNTLRITAELQSSKSWVRLFSYTANRTNYQVG